MQEEDPMAAELSNDELKRLARLGAVTRLDQIEEERRAILRAFPALAASSARQKPAAPSPGGRPAAEAPKTTARKRRKMTAEEKKAASERMKQYWAARKQG
jgi:hypothetical protein